MASSPSTFGSPDGFIHRENYEIGNFTTVVIKGYRET